MGLVAAYSALMWITQGTFTLTMFETVVVVVVVYTYKPNAVGNTMFVELYILVVT